jgi:hypothetical protein
MYFVAMLGVLGLLCLLVGFVCGVYAERNWRVPLWQIEDGWSIGIYAGVSPFDLVARTGASNPVLTARDVRDVTAAFVADPFMVREGSTWYMFFEVLDARTYEGKIGLAVSQDGLRWAYERVVLSEPYHLSYPYVFKWQNQYYMVPDCRGVDSIRLYKAVRFPTDWSFVRVLVDEDYVDSSLLHHADRWWLFAANLENDTLHLFHADNLMGSWSEHPQSPIVKGNPHIARPAGRILALEPGDRIFRYAQDDEPTYGNQVRAFEITELTSTNYREKEVSPTAVIKASGRGWNAHGMHNIDAHPMSDGTWIACVDGNHTRLTFRLRW